MGLLDIYEGMQKEAAAKQLKLERLEMLEKYASVSEQMLSEEFGDAYDANDVEKLAEYLINHDLQSQDEMAKVAEYDEMGRIMARSFIDEMNKA